MSLNAATLSKGRSILIDYGVDAIPTMTTNTAPSGVASADSEEVSLEAYKAMNDALGASDHWRGTTPNGGWLQYAFAAGAGIIPVRYTIRARQSTGDQAPKTFTFEGSNTGSFGGEETVLDTQTGLSWSADEKKTFDFSNTARFRYFRLDITAIVFAGEPPIIQEFEIIPGVFA